MPKSQWKFGIALLPFALMLGAMFADHSPAHSAPQSNTFTVDVTGDGTDANAGDGICLTTGGACTLRAAVQEANAPYLSAGSAYTISLPPIGPGSSAATFLLTLPDGWVGEAFAAKGDLDIR